MRPLAPSILLKYWIENLPSRSFPDPTPCSLCGKFRADGHAPYDENAMLFMDYRTDYVDKTDLSAEEAKGLDEIPTFLYAMPMGTAPNGRKRIFFEEVRASRVHTAAHG